MGGGRPSAGVPSAWSGPLEPDEASPSVSELPRNTQQGMFAVSHVEGSREILSRGGKPRSQVRVHWLGYEEPSWEDEEAFPANDLAELRRREKRLSRTVLGSVRSGRQQGSSPEPRVTLSRKRQGPNTES